MRKTGCLEIENEFLDKLPLAAKQPDQSPYKAFLNNPLVFVDPKGETEYESVVIKDEKTGQTTTLYITHSNLVMTDGAVHMYKAIHPIISGIFVGNPNFTYKFQAYYDYRHVTYYTKMADGTMRLDNTETEILYKNGIKHLENVTMDYAFDLQSHSGAVISLDDYDYEQAGGFYMTGSGGQGTKYYSKNADYVGDIDMLISILSNYSTQAKFKLTNKGFDDDAGLYQMLETLADQTKNNTDKINKIKEIVDAVKDEKRSSERLFQKSSNTARVCNPTSDGGCEHPKADQEQIHNGDTLGGKNPQTGETNKCSTETRQKK